MWITFFTICFHVDLCCAVSVLVGFALLCSGLCIVVYISLVAAALSGYLYLAQFTFDLAQFIYCHSAVSHFIYCTYP